MFHPFIVIVMYYSLTILSLIVSFLLVYKYITDLDQTAIIHQLTRMLALLMFFVFIDGLYNSFLFSSLYGLLSFDIYQRLSTSNIQIVPIFGIFISIIFIAYFILGDKLAHIRHREKHFDRMEEMNRELEERSYEMAQKQKRLEDKFRELEKFNTIAKRRETKIVELVKRVEELEEELNEKAA